MTAAPSDFPEVCASASCVACADQLRARVRRCGRAVLVEWAGSSWQALTVGLTGRGLPEVLLRGAGTKQVALDLVAEASAQLLTAQAIPGGLFALDQGDGCEQGDQCGHGWSEGCGRALLLRGDPVDVVQAVSAPVLLRLFPRAAVRVLELLPASLN